MVVMQKADVVGYERKVWFNKGAQI